MATTPPKTTAPKTTAPKTTAPKYTPEQQKTLAQMAQARQIANQNKLYSYQTNAADQQKANDLEKEHSGSNAGGWTTAGYGNTPGGFVGSNGITRPIAQQISNLRSKQLVTNPENSIASFNTLGSPDYNPYVQAMQRQDLIAQEQKGMNLQAAADGTMYDLNDPASKKEFDENNAYWASVGGYRLKKGGAVKPKRSKPSKPTKKYASGGVIFSKRGDGCASKGRTKCKIR